MVKLIHFARTISCRKLYQHWAAELGVIIDNWFKFKIFQYVRSIPNSLYSSLNGDVSRMENIFQFAIISSSVQTFRSKREKCRINLWFINTRLFFDVISLDFKVDGKICDINKSRRKSEQPQKIQINNIIVSRFIMYFVKISSISLLSISLFFTYIFF